MKGWVVLGLFLVLTLAGCASQSKIVEEDNIKFPPEQTLYKITDTLNYFDVHPENINEQYYQGCAGLRFIITDVETKKPINSSGLIYRGTSSSLFGNSIENRTDCTAKLSENTVLIVRLYAKGYSPLSFNVSAMPNKIIILKISLPKSCTTGPSCFDNVAIEGRNVTYAKDYVRNIFTRKFNISNYEFKCIECSIERGGFIKGIATTPDQGEFDFYHRGGWCSSGGADCTDTRCLSTPNTELYNAFKDLACEMIYSKSYYDETTNQCTNTLKYDNTTETREACMAGAFSEFKDGINSISLISSSGSCTSYAKKTNTNCLEN